MNFLQVLLVELKKRSAALATAGFSFLIVASVWAQDTAAPVTATAPAVAPASAAPAISAGDTAWVLASAALVLDSATELARQSELMRSEVNSFLATIRAA